MKPIQICLLFWAASAAIAGAQQPLRLSLKEAIALATSPRGSASVQLADAAADQQRAHVALSHAFRYPLLTAGISESNVTRNLSAEGFNFPTGVPNFTIPESVGPFQIFDARVDMTETLFDLSAIRQARGIAAGYSAARSDADTHRQASAAQAAHDYLLALQAGSTIDAAQAAITQAESTLRTAQDRVDQGKAADSELTAAQLSLAAARRRLVAANNAAAQSRLQLLDDLGLDFNTQLLLTDKLTYTPDDTADNKADIDTAIAQALSQRPELQTAAQRQLQARDDVSAIAAQKLPTVSAFGDVGPLDTVLTHTVGVSAKITVFDGGRRKAQEQESQATVREYDIRQRDLRRQVELQVRRAFLSLQSAAAQAQQCAAALQLSQDQLARTQRRYDAGVATTADLAAAQLSAAQARDDQTQAFFAWNQARVDLAEATGSITALTLP